MVFQFCPVKNVLFDSVIKSISENLITLYYNIMINVCVILLVLMYFYRKKRIKGLLWPILMS